MRATQREAFAMTAALNDPSGPEAEPVSSEADTNHAVIELRGIRKSFGENEVLRGVDLQGQAGEHAVIFGPSGSGKSTLLRTINLLEPPTAGSVRVAGLEYAFDDGAGVRRGTPMELRRT